MTGLDASTTLLRIAQDRFPGRDWHLGDMRDFDLGLQFDGIIAWNSFFHLTEAGQIQALACIARHLTPGGVFMTTVGPGAGPVTGHVAGELVFHASLAPADYEKRLDDVGLTVTAFVPEDPDCAGHSVLLAVAG